MIKLQLTLPGFLGFAALTALPAHAQLVYDTRLRPLVSATVSIELDGEQLSTGDIASPFRLSGPGGITQDISERIELTSDAGRSAVATVNMAYTIGPSGATVDLQIHHFDVRGPLGETGARIESELAVFPHRTELSYTENVRYQLHVYSSFDDSRLFAAPSGDGWIDQDTSFATASFGRGVAGGLSADFELLAETGGVSSTVQGWVSRASRLRSPRVSGRLITLPGGPSVARSDTHLDVHLDFRVLSTRFGCSLADWDGNEVIDTNDFSAYLADWSATEPDADLTTSGTADFTAIDGNVDMSDFAYFLALWAEGCP